MEAKLIKDFFTSSTICIRQSASLKEVIQLIKSNNIRHIPVVNDKDMVIGMISDRDILPLVNIYGEKGEKNETFEKIEVKTIMTKDVQVISVDESLGEAAHMMIDGEFHALPVVENQKLAGIITSTDLLRFMVEEEGVTEHRR